MDDRADERRILLVEDEPLVALLVEDMLASLGLPQTKLATHLDDAVAAAQREPLDFAILDVHIAGEFVFPVADILADRHIPFMFATGRGAEDIPARHRGRPLLTKPFPPEELLETLARFVPHATGTPSRH